MAQDNLWKMHCMRNGLTSAAKAGAQSGHGYRSGEPLHPSMPKSGLLGAPVLRHPESSAAADLSSS
jgi:hypothetical protein